MKEDTRENLRSAGEAAVICLVIAPTLALSTPVILAATALSASMAFFTFGALQDGRRYMLKKAHHQLLLENNAHNPRKISEDRPS